MAGEYAQTNEQIIAALMASDSPQFALPTVDQAPMMGGGAVAPGGNMASRAGAMSRNVLEEALAPGLPPSPVPTMQQMPDDLHKMQKQVAMPQSLQRAAMDAQIAKRDYLAATTRRFSGIPGLIESVFDRQNQKQAGPAYAEAQANLEQEQMAFLNHQIESAQDVRYKDALAIIGQNNPHLVTGKTPDGRPIYSDGADAMARQYATSDMSVKDLGTVAFRQYTGIQEDKNGRPRYVGGEKNGQLVFPGVVITPDLQETLKTEEGFRKEVNSLTSDFRTVASAFDRLNSDFEDPTGATDMRMIFSFMNMLDPGVSVRADDYNNVASTRGWSGEMKALWQQVFEGEKLTPAQRRHLAEEGRKLYGAAYDSATRVADHYAGVATRAGVNVENVIGLLDQYEVPTAPQLPIFSTPEEIQKQLDSGQLQMGDEVVLDGKRMKLTPRTK